MKHVSPVTLDDLGDTPHVRGRWPALSSGKEPASGTDGQMVRESEQGGSLGRGGGRGRAGAGPGPGRRILCEGRHKPGLFLSEPGKRAIIVHPPSKMRPSLTRASRSERLHLFGCPLMGQSPATHSPWEPSKQHGLRGSGWWLPGKDSHVLSVGTVSYSPYVILARRPGEASTE